MADEAAEFWSKFEEETGEKVQARSLGELRKASSRDIGTWGLLVLTDKSFRFKYMPNDNWLLSLFKKADRSSEAKKPVDIVIPRGDIVSVKAPRGGFFARLFGPAFPVFSITSREAEGEQTQFFTVDPSSGLLAALVEAAPAGETTSVGS
jgi:hypothetical protein